MEKYELPTWYCNKNPNLPVVDFLKILSEKSKNHVERRSSQFLLDCGQDLSMFAHRVKNKNFSDDLPPHQCHKVSWRLLRSAVELFPERLPQLWWGFMEVWDDKGYRGLFRHSFLSFIDKEKNLVIHDPYVHQHFSFNPKVHFTSYFGVHLPYFWIKSLQSMASAGYWYNYNYHLQDVVFNSDVLTEEFTNIVRKEKELRKKLFCLLHKRLYFASDFTVLCSNFDNPTKGPHLRAFLFDKA